MTNLTDKWRKGELPSGWYWVEGSRAEGIYAYTAEYLNNMYRPRNDERVVEQVPSYEEWDKLNNACHNLEKETACLTVDIVKLKKLLKRCKRHINASFPEIYRELLQDLNQVLGEE